MKEVRVVEFGFLAMGLLRPLAGVRVLNPDCLATGVCVEWMIPAFGLVSSTVCQLELNRRKLNLLDRCASHPLINAIGLVHEFLEDGPKLLCALNVFDCHIPFKPTSQRSWVRTIPTCQHLPVGFV